jgi:hypothetical protein
LSIWLERPMPGLRWTVQVSPYPGELWWHWSELLVRASQVSSSLLDALALPSDGKVISFGLDTADASVDPRDVRIRAPLAVQRPESAVFEQFCGDEVAFGPVTSASAGLSW